MIVTIGGKRGSGKTSVGRLVAERLGYRFYSIGDMRGKMAMEKGMTIDEFNKLAEKEEWADTEFDEYTRKVGKEEDNFVIDAWLGFHFIPHSVKVFLDVEPEEGAKRIFKDQRPDEPRKGTVGEILEMGQKRVEKDRERWKKRYGADILDMGNYDFVLDTTGLTKAQVVEKVLEFLKKRKGQASRM